MKSLYLMMLTRSILVLIPVLILFSALSLNVVAQELHQRQKFANPDSIDNWFGFSVSLSGDGKTALVISFDAAYVFVQIGSTFSIQQKLSGIVSADPHAIVDGALSGDGNTVLIGRPYSVLIFARLGDTWIQQQELKNPEYGFGHAVALSDDGNTALVGAAWEACASGNSCGAAYVFVRSGSSWALQHKLTASDLDEYDRFGDSVALSGDGQTALIGATETKCNTGVKRGAAYVFVPSGNSWNQQQKLTAGDAFQHSTFGSSVALSDNGDIALIGAVEANCVLKEDPTGVGEKCGAAYVFDRNGNTWSQQQKLTAPDIHFWAFEFWGSVAITDGGDIALVGARGDDYCSQVTDLGHCGSAYVFLHSGSGWNQKQKFTAVDAKEGKQFGWSVALSGDGNIAFVGADWDYCATGDHSCGAAYVFTRKCATPEGEVLIDPDCISFIPSFSLENWIPVGCEIIDCCPGCPGDRVIDWIIRVDGDPVDALILRFENLNPVIARQLRIEGDAKWLKDNRLQIKGQGETIIRGFPVANVNDMRGSLSSPRMTLDRIVLREPMKGLGKHTDKSLQGTGTIRLRVEQKVQGEH